MAMLQVAGLRKRFGGLQAVDGVDLDVADGELRAVIGPNGAGKSTLFNLITGYHRPDEGTVRFAGEDITGLPTHRIARTGIGRAFQITSIFGGLTVHENVRLGIMARRRESTRVVGRVEGLHADGVRQILGDVGLLEVEDVLAGNLSHGDQRALELATTLALDPKLLLLDEPTSGMGREDIARTADLIRRAAEKRTVLMVEHNLSVVSDLSHRITVLARGEVLAEGPYAEVSANPAVIEAYMGSDAHA